MKTLPVAWEICSSVHEIIFMQKQKPWRKRCKGEVWVNCRGARQKTIVEHLRKDTTYCMSLYRFHSEGHGTESGILASITAFFENERNRAGGFGFVNIHLLFLDNMAAFTQS